MARKGRKRKARVAYPEVGSPTRREKNGQLSRRATDRRTRAEMTEKEAKSVMISARMRHSGLTEECVDGKPETGKPNVGTPHGLLHLQGYLKIDQWRSAEFYLNKRNEYLQSIKAPGAQFQSGHESNADEEAYARWCEAVEATWQEITRCIRDVSVEVRSPVASALDHILERQQPNLSHMHGDLRIGLNAIYRSFLVSRPRCAA